MNMNTAKIGIALMTDLATVPSTPTHTLRVRKFADPTPQFIETEDDVAVGNRFGAQKVIQGVQVGNQEIQATATLRDLPILLQTLLGTPDNAGLITPRPDQFGALMPVQPLAVWQKHPDQDALFPAAMISKLTINVPNRNTADVSVTLNTARVNDMPAVSSWPAAASTDLLRFLNWWVKIDNKVYAPESGSITIEQGLKPQDGAQGLDEAGRMYILGYSLEGQLKVSLSFVLNEVGAAKGGGSFAGLVALSKPDLSTGERAQKLVETGFNLGTGKEIKFALQGAELKLTQSRTGLGDTTLSFTAEPAVIGTAPLLVTVPTA